ncbi:MAG: hypothetical protein RMJ97_05670, partial [Raineya sp.]|nr:hypothetical protein [Raineya sp.]
IKSLNKPSILFRMPLNKMLTYEIHFFKPPKTLKIANLYEGRVAKKRRNHFHALEIPIKHSLDDDLGTEEDMRKNINDFVKENYTEPKPQKSIPQPQKNAPHHTARPRAKTSKLQ